MIKRVTTDAEAFSANSIPPTELRETILDKTSRLVMLPDIAARALRMATDPETSIKSFAHLVQRDIKLASDVLSLANGVMYSAGQTTASLPHAIARLGFEKCKNLVIASSIKSAICGMELDTQWTRNVLWKHSITTGVIAVDLNRRLHAGFAGDEFAAGLIHDFGRLLMATAFPDSFATFDSLNFDESAETLERENEATGSNHCVVGAWFAATQGLPKSLCDVIRNHHTPEQCNENLRLVALTAIADHMANYHHRFGESGEYDPKSNSAVELLEQTGIKNARSEFQRIASDVLATSVAEADHIISN